MINDVLIHKTQRFHNRNSTSFNILKRHVSPNGGKKERMHGILSSPILKAANHIGAIDCKELPNLEDSARLPI